MGAWLQLRSLVLVASIGLLAWVVPVAAEPPASVGRDSLGQSAPQVRRLDDAGRVEVRATVLASEDEPPSAARARALGLARQAAVEFVAGVRIKTGSLSFDQVRDSDASSLLQILTSVRADALMVEEKLVSHRLVPLTSGGYRVSIVLRGRVLDRSAAAHSDFEAEIELPETHLAVGDEVSLRMRANRGARFYVIGISDDGATLLLPNAHHPDTRVRAGRWLEFPDAGARARGVRLVAQLPKGRRRSHEALLVLALEGRRELVGMRPSGQQQFRAVESDDAGALLADFLEPLLEIPASEWSFDQVVYEIRER